MWSVFSVHRYYKTSYPSQTKKMLSVHKTEGWLLFLLHYRIIIMLRIHTHPCNTTNTAVDMNTPIQVLAAKKSSHGGCSQHKTTPFRVGGSNKSVCGGAIKSKPGPKNKTWPPASSPQRHQSGLGPVALDGLHREPSTISHNVCLCGCFSIFWSFFTAAR